MAHYPDNMLIRFVARHYYNVPERKKVRFLDVGCGVGASTWYLAREGFSVAAIDSSIVAIDTLKHRLEKENLEALLACGDITKLELKEDFFDAIIDVSSLCYVPEADIGNLMKGLYRVLKPGGRMFSICPTNECARNPFNKTIDDVDLEARFQTYDQARDNFRDFSGVNMSTCSYSVGVGENEQLINLWVIDAVK